MAPIRVGKDAVVLVATVFFVSFSYKILLPVPCYLPVSYSPIFFTSQDLPHPIFTLSFGLEKNAVTPRITALSSLSIFSIHNV